MRVLGITADWGSGFLRTVRMEMPLANLKRQGCIDDFAVTDRHLRNVDPQEQFDAVWLQRVDEPHLLATLNTTIGSRYLYDIDDFLLGRAAYIHAPLTRSRVAVISALKQCAHLTTPTHRLRSMLENEIGATLEAKATVCPNGSEFPYGMKPNERPSGLIWVSSVNAALTDSRTEVVQAVNDFSRRHNLPIWYVGICPPDLLEKLDRVHTLGAMSYWQYTSWLASRSPMIGIAPVETTADDDTLTVIRGKSDVKMAEFSGFGHLGIYSDAPPYRESDLKVGCLTANTRRSWEDSLEESLSERWKTRRDEQEKVVSLRQMDTLAQECWLPAISSVKLESPLRAKDILPHAGRGMVIRDIAATLRANSAVYRSLRKLIQTGRP